MVDDESGEWTGYRNFVVADVTSCAALRQCLDTEFQCVDAEFQCVDTEFQCVDSLNCISSSMRCDLFPDCSDASDEAGCSK